MNFLIFATKGLLKKNVENTPRDNGRDSIRIPLLSAPSGRDGIPSVQNKLDIKYNYKNREKECKYLLEKHLKVPFEKARPTFMRNPKTKRLLELDLYNEDLKIGLEYMGVHHSHYSEHFHKTRDKFKELVERDKLKKQLCKDAGVFLIIVHYNILDINLEDYILQAIDVWRKTKQ